MEKIRRKEILGFNVDLLTSNEALKFVEIKVDSRENLQIVTINPEIIIKAMKDNNLASVINSSQLVLPESTGVELALLLKGIKQKRVNGIEFAQGMLKLANDKGYRIAFLGAKKEVLDKMLQNIKKDYDRLNIVYASDGYFDDEKKVIEDIKNSSPQMLFCALGNPKQEFMNSKILNTVNGLVAIGIGGSFDVWSGTVKRAPKIWQKMGLEWLYRTIKEPSRFKRIFPTLPLFLFYVIMDTIKIKGLR